jgi:GNAT superfamily N-acetyltransferase
LKNTVLSNEIKTLNKAKHFNEFPESIVYITNHNDITFIVTCKQSSDFRGRIGNIEFNGYNLDKISVENPYAKPFISLTSVAVYDRGLDYLRNLFIQEFSAEPCERDKGYGSIVIKQFIKYAKHLDVGYISGRLSPVDIGNEYNKKESRERIYHFYPKHGFTIKGEMLRLQLKTYSDSPAVR